MSGYPIELRLSGRRVLIVGLGAVGRRKAVRLVACGAQVLAVDPQPSPRLAGVDQLVEPFQPEHLNGVRLVFAAATPEVNTQVVRAARQRGLWVNSASDPEEGDFSVPAIWIGGRVCLSVSTGGAGPALAARLRDLASQSLGTEVEVWADLLAELRPRVLERVSDLEARKRLLLRWSESHWLDRIRAAGIQDVRDAFLAQLEETVRKNDSAAPPV